MRGRVRQVVIYFKFHENRSRGLGAVGGRKSPSPIDKAMAYTTACTTVQAVKGSTTCLQKQIGYGELHNGGKIRDVSASVYGREQTTVQTRVRQTTEILKSFRRDSQTIAMSYYIALACIRYNTTHMQRWSIDDNLNSKVSILRPSKRHKRNA